ncbi:unnamed protein product [Cylicostephanus goldi]|uniref:Uncharacterized protein n=1 Tax=Cylicostephanus goldi TaxID=71465 RepID=A0A3P6TNA9_CYLGO|nr:unnamed protein product [Cylicostephanus goldi]
MAEFVPIPVSLNQTLFDWLYTMIHKPVNGRTLSASSKLMTAVMAPTSWGQPHQIRAVPRGFTLQGTRVMNDCSDVPASFSSQLLPMQWGGKPGGATLVTPRAPRVRRHSPFS